MLLFVRIVHMWGSIFNLVCNLRSNAGPEQDVWSPVGGKRSIKSQSMQCDLPNKQNLTCIKYLSSCLPIMTESKLGPELTQFLRLHMCSLDKA